MGSRKGVGGANFHRPGCRCNPCKKRAREAAGALARGEAPPTPPTPIDPVAAIVKTNVIDMTRPESLASLQLIGLDDNNYLTKVIEWGKLRLVGKQTKEIAELLGVSYGTLRNYLSKARKDGYLVLADPEDVIEHELVDKAVDTYRFHLDDNNLGAAKDIMAGTGRWKSHQAIKAETNTITNVLAINISLPPTPDQSINEPGIFGKGHVIDVEATKED